MSSLDELFQTLPIDQIAQEVGADQNDVRQATATILPALVGGLQANAQDPTAAANIEQELQQQDPSLLDGGIDVSQIDQQQGSQLASRIFGSNEDQVVNQLSALGGPGLDSPLVKKLIPILAPIVVAYLAKQIFGGTTTHQQQQSGGGILGDILGQVLGGHQQQTSQRGPEVQTQDPAPQPQGMPSMPSVPSEPAEPTQQSSGNGSIDDIINQAITNGSPAGQQQEGQAPQRQQQGGVGSILGSVLGGLLGGGHR